MKKAIEVLSVEQVEQYKLFIYNPNVKDFVSRSLANAEVFVISGKAHNFILHCVIDFPKL